MRPTNPNITEEEWAEYRRRTAPVDIPPGVLPAEASDPLWRIANLYTITKEGKEVHFEPHTEQASVLICIFIRGWQRIVIPKARQLGFSTLLSIIMLDGQIWDSGFQGALIDKTAPDAEKKMREKIQFSWDKIPAAVRSNLIETKRTSEQLSIIGKGKNEVESSSYGAINFRGGTVTFLWISEWGWVQNNDRPRSLAIASGALPAIERAEKGLCVVETTWSGGLDGELGPIVNEALETPESMKGPKSWRVVFFGWQTCPLYQRTYGYVDPMSAQYFAKMEKDYGIILTEPQKLWYAEQRRTAKSQRTFREEYPTVAEECWQNVPEGSIYGELIAQAEAEGRIRDFEIDNAYPSDTFWDIGLPVNTVTWIVQIRPEAILVHDCILEQDVMLPDRLALMNAKPYRYRLHCFPHDAGVRQSSGLAQIDEFARVLGQGCRVVPKVAIIQHGIDLLQTLFPRLVFHKTKCKVALEMLGRYRAERETTAGLTKWEPVHDRYSHGADALRQLAQALDARMIPNAHIVGAAVEAVPFTQSVPRAILAGQAQRTPAPRAIMTR